MKVRTDANTVVFELVTEKMIELTWEELEQLKQLIRVLTLITDYQEPVSLSLRL